MKGTCPAHGLVDVVIDGTCGVCGTPTTGEDGKPTSAQNLDAEIAAFHKAGKKSGTGVMLIGGLVMLAAGILVFAISFVTSDDSYAQLSTRYQGRSLVAGLALAAAGIALTVQGVRARRSAR